MFHQNYTNTLCWKFPVPFIFNYFGSIANTCHKMRLTHKHYKETLEHLLTNVLELMSESPIRNNLIHNDCDCIEDLIKTTDKNIPNVCYKISTKALGSLSIVHRNLIQIFISYFH